MSIAKSQGRKQPSTRKPLRGVRADLVGLLAILGTVITLVALLGPAAGTVLAAAGGFVGVTLRLWLRRR